MKKFALLLTLALPMVIASCGDDNDVTLSLNQSNITVNYDGTATLTASEKNVNWSSDNEFVATVDKDGKVEGQHVGTCTITATKNGETATCTVNVVPTDNSFKMPYLVWHATKQQIINNFTGFQLRENNDENSVAYFTNVANSTLPGYLYSLNNGNYTGLYQSTLLVDEDDSLKAYQWLEQYYNEVSTDNDEDFIYADKDKNEVAVLGAIVDEDGETVLGWGAFWTAPDYTSTKSVNAVKEGKVAARNLLKNK